MIWCIVPTTCLLIDVRRSGHCSDDSHMASHSLSLHLSKFSRNSFSVMKPSKFPSNSKNNSPMAASSTLELESSFLKEGYEIVFFGVGPACFVNSDHTHSVTPASTQPRPAGFSS